MSILDTSYIDETLEQNITASVGRVIKPGHEYYIIVTYKPSGTEVHQNHNNATFYETKKQAELVAEIINKGFDTLD